MKCNLCPRSCGVDRASEKGVCGESDRIRIALYSLHRYEEPPVSGVRGSGAIFFSGCPLKCVFCQNNEISHRGKGQFYSVSELADIMLSLQNAGAHNINLVTPTHFSDKIFQAIESVKDRLHIPIIYNCSGYESSQTLKNSEGLIDVFLPDFKYFSSALSAKYSAAPDYFSVASAAIAEMLELQPQVVMKDGVIQKGVIIRHLVLPGCVDDSLAVLNHISRYYHGALVSIMRQYTPDFYTGTEKNLRRKLTSYEYDKVINEAIRLNLDGFIQQKGCETPSYTPNFQVP